VQHDYGYLVRGLGENIAKQGVNAKVLFTIFCLEILMLIFEG
jgi:hypothetical protein